MSGLDGLLWVFGYGSLIWKPPEGFQHVKAIPGGIQGWHRRLWQGSTDHRGLPGDPGLVATLLQTKDLPETDRPPEDELCWGMCYGYDESERDRVLQYLDYREKDGYDRTRVDVHLKGGEGGGKTPDIHNVLLYVATTSNPQYLGPLTNQQVAERVAKAVGPSGTNHEYVTNLATGLVAMQVEDAHIQDVVRRMEGMELAAAGSTASPFLGDGQYKGDGGWMLQKLWELPPFAWKEVQGSPGVYEGEGGPVDRVQVLGQIGWPDSMSPTPAQVALPSPGLSGGAPELAATVAKFPCGGGLVDLDAKPGFMLCTESALQRMLAGAGADSS